MKILRVHEPKIDHNFRQWWHMDTDSEHDPSIFTDDDFKAALADRAFKLNLAVDVRTNFGYITSIALTESGGS